MTPSDLRRFRAHHGLPQAELARILQISRQGIVEMEMGRRRIPAWLALALAAYEAGLGPYAAPEGAPIPVRVNRRRSDGSASA